MKAQIRTWSSLRRFAVFLFALSWLGMAGQAAAQQQAQRPNIVVIMGDDIGIWNIGAYSRGMMAGRTPNLELKQIAV